MSLTVITHPSPLPAGQSSRLCEENVTSGPQSSITDDPRHALPSVAELVALAINETDFLGDLDPATLNANAENSADLAAELWEEARGYPVNSMAVPLRRIIATRRALQHLGWVMICRREIEVADALADGIESGDLDTHGAPVPYDRYHGGL